MRFTPSAIAAKAAQGGRKDLAWEAACRSLVLLKNEGHALPLRDDPGAIAVIGPLADAKGEDQEPVAATETSDKAIAVLDGLRSALPKARVAFTPGCGIERIGTAGRAKRARAHAAKRCHHPLSRRNAGDERRGWKPWASGPARRPMRVGTHSPRPKETRRDPAVFRAPARAAGLAGRRRRTRSWRHGSRAARLDARSPTS